MVRHDHLWNIVNDYPAYKSTTYVPKNLDYVGNTMLKWSAQSSSNFWGLRFNSIDNVSNVKPSYTPTVYVPPAAESLPQGLLETPRQKYHHCTRWTWASRIYLWMRQFSQQCPANMTRNTPSTKLVENCCIMPSVLVKGIILERLVNDTNLSQTRQLLPKG